jgi:hypothetical protein
LQEEESEEEYSEDEDQQVQLKHNNSTTKRANYKMLEELGHDTNRIEECANEDDILSNKENN